ncbi:unnamed protein product [Urochloa humidicola]
MLSSGGLVYGIINIAGGFATIFADNGYWMSAIAARLSSAHKGYLLGGLLFFALPFSLATSLGLGALALGLPLTRDEAAKGLVPAATATVLMGKPGSILLLTRVFMTITSAGSAELVAVSSLCTYDVYRTHTSTRTPPASRSSACPGSSSSPLAASWASSPSSSTSPASPSGGST